MTKLLDFYLNEGKDTEMRTLEEIWGFTFGQLEMTHDYIQWLFPTPQPSNFNADAPLLTKYEAEQFQKNVKLRQHMTISFKKMLYFFGLEMVVSFSDDPYVAVVEGHNFEEQKKVLFEGFNHNHLRVTRILTCLTMCGFKDYAEAFLEFLSKHRENISDNTMGHWAYAVHGPLGG